MVTFRGPDGREYQIDQASHLDLESGLVAFSDEFAAFQFLSRLTDDYFNVVQLRQLAEELATSGELTQLSDHHLLQRLASGLVDGRLSVGRGASVTTGWESSERGGGSADTRDDDDESDDSAPPPTDTDELTWIQFQVIDQDSGEPVRGVTLQVKLTTGKTVPKKTDGNGMIEFTDIPSGTCDIVRMIDSDSWEVVSVG